MTRKISGLVVRTDGTTERVELSDDWQSIANAIGSQYIEGVTVARDLRIYVDEEGRIHDEPKYNAVLSGLSGHPMGLYGDGFVLGGMDDEGNDLSLPEPDMALIEEYAKRGRHPVENPANREPRIEVLTGDAAFEAMFGKKE